MKYLIANWKANKNIATAKEWLAQISFSANFSPSSTEIIIAPPYSLLPVLAEEIAKRQLPIKLAVQDLSPFPAGAYTGEVSAVNLQGLNIQYAILGHSERRRYFAESDQLIANKVAQALENSIKPILCLDDDYIVSQAAALEKKYLSQIIAAYENRSAIGTGRNQPLETVREYRELIRQAFGSIPVLYGGSVRSDNVIDYWQELDGVLIGGASLDARQFQQILQRI